MLRAEKKAYYCTNYKTSTESELKEKLQEQSNKLIEYENALS